MELVEPIRDKKQLEAMKKYLKNQSLRDYALFMLGINTALRISDILTLTVEDINIALDHRMQGREGKTGKLKDTPLAQMAGVKKAIQEYLKESQLTTGPLFPSRTSDHGKPKAISRIQAYRIINAAAKSVGIKDSIGTHTMRKTFGYHAYLQGVDITRIQKLLNHSAPSITLAYIGITKDELDQVYININL